MAEGARQLAPSFRNTTWASNSYLEVYLGWKGYVNFGLPTKAAKAAAERRTAKRLAREPIWAKKRRLRSGSDPADRARGPVMPQH